jgi:hypothetical protein
MRADTGGPASCVGADRTSAAARAARAVDRLIAAMIGRYRRRGRIVTQFQTNRNALMTERAALR